MKRPLRYIKFFLFLALFWGVERLCHQATDGFALVNIYSPKGRHLDWESQLPLNEVEAVLDQPFDYLSSGSQSYVFLSRDGTTILKFFKFQHMRIPPWIDALPLPQSLDQKRTLKKEKKQKVLTETLSSYKIAFEHLKDETGLLYVHLGPTSHLNQSVTIYDKIGKRHVIALDDVEFVVQKRAELVYDTLDQWMAKGDLKLAKKGLHDLIQLALLRCKKGIFDKDPDFSTNFGFDGEVPLQIDVGRLALSEEEKNPEIYRDEMVRITRSFQEWIEKNHPDLLSFFDDEIENIRIEH